MSIRFLVKLSEQADETHPWYYNIYDLLSYLD